MGFSHLETVSFKSPESTFYCQREAESPHSNNSDSAASAFLDLLCLIGILREECKEGGGDSDHFNEPFFLLFHRLRVVSPKFINFNYSSFNLRKNTAEIFPSKAGWMEASSVQMVGAGPVQRAAGSLGSRRQNLQERSSGDIARCPPAGLHLSFYRRASEER